MFGKITRADFLKSGFSLLAAAQAPRVLAGMDKGSSPAAEIAGPYVRELNPVLRLYPAKADERSGEVRFGPAEITVMLPFFGSGKVTWSVTAPHSGSYRLALCYAAAVSSANVRVGDGKGTVEFAVRPTEGFLLPDPAGPAASPSGPDGDTFWSEREFYNFERVALEGELHLECGVNVVTLEVTAPKGKEVFRLRSLELTPTRSAPALEADTQRALKKRASTDWFVKAGYGLWFHFLDLTTPRRGARKSYKEAVRDLDVEAVAQMVANSGAGYMIITTNHGNPTCPAPIKSWENLHPGWTTERDLIGELSDALARHDIRLMLYMNCPGLGGLVQQPGTGLDLPGVSEEQYEADLARVFSEFGHRYGERLAGYWLDSWFQTDETYPNLSFEKLGAAIKAGYPGRLVSYNHWAFPIETGWQDYWCGELTDLPLKPFGSRYIRRGAGRGLQSHSAIRLDAPWFHITPDIDMEPPRYSPEQLSDYIKSCMADSAPVTLGVGMFQDGTIGEKSAAVLARVRQIIRGA